MTQLDKPIYTIAETCEVLGIHRDTLRGIILCGELRTIKVGKRRRVTREALRAYLAGTESK